MVGVVRGSGVCARGRGQRAKQQLCYVACEVRGDLPSAWDAAGQRTHIFALHAQGASANLFFVVGDVHPQVAVVHAQDAASRALGDGSLGAGDVPSQCDTGADLDGRVGRRVGQGIAANQRRGALICDSKTLGVKVHIHQGMV